MGTGFSNTGLSGVLAEEPVTEKREAKDCFMECRKDVLGRTVREVKGGEQEVGAETELVGAVRTGTEGVVGTGGTKAVVTVVAGSTGSGEADVVGSTGTEAVLAECSGTETVGAGITGIVVALEHGTVVKATPAALKMFKALLV